MEIQILIYIILLSVIPITVTIFIIIPFLFGASYEPSRKRVVKQMISFAKPGKQNKLAELGSGDGKIVIEFAKMGVESHGYEINPILVLWSRYKIKKLKLQDKAFIHWKNFWKEDLSKFDIITIFQFKHLMKPLEKKLKKELKKDSIILSNIWKFPNLKPIKESNKVYMYKT